MMMMMTMAMMPRSGSPTAAYPNIRGVGRNSVVIVPGPAAARRHPRGVAGAGSIDSTHRGSGGSGIEQDWEAMLRAGPPR